VNAQKDAFIDLGLGTSLTSEYLCMKEGSSYRDYFINIVPKVSYRKHFNNSTFFRVGLNAVINDFGITPWQTLA
jgi:hypothetical protein